MCYQTSIGRGGSMRFSLRSRMRVELSSATSSQDEGRPGSPMHAEAKLCVCVSKFVFATRGQSVSSSTTATGDERTGIILDCITLGLSTVEENLVLPDQHNGNRSDVKCTCRTTLASMSKASGNDLTYYLLAAKRTGSSVQTVGNVLSCKECWNKTALPSKHRRNSRGVTSHPHAACTAEQSAAADESSAFLSSVSVPNEEWASRNRQYCRKQGQLDFLRAERAEQSISQKGGAEGNQIPSVESGVRPQLIYIKLDRCWLFCLLECHCELRLRLIGCLLLLLHFKASLARRSRRVKCRRRLYLLPVEMVCIWYCWECLPHGQQYQRRPLC
jgi:hypothetical protein